MLHQDVFEELLPAFHHVGGFLLGIVCEDFDVFLGMCLLCADGQFFYHLALLDDGLLQRIAHLLKVGEDFGVIGIDVVADGVLQPESTLRGVVQVVAFAGDAFVAIGYFARSAIDGGEGGHVGIVVGKPDHAANGIGQFGAHLAYNAEGCLLCGDRTFVEVFPAIQFPSKGGGEVGHLVGACTQLVAEVDGCVLVVVAHGGHHALQADTLFVGLHVEWHFSVTGSRVGHGYESESVVGIFGHAAIETVEDAPHAGFAVAGGTEVAGGKGIAEGEVSILLAREEALLAGKADDVL